MFFFIILIYNLCIGTTGHVVTLVYVRSGSLIRCIVKYEAIFAVYVETNISAKKHQTTLTILPDKDLKRKKNYRS